jgi:hypothetical protein
VGWACDRTGRRCDETVYAQMVRVRDCAGFANVSHMDLDDDDLHSRLPRSVLSDLGGWTLYQNFRTFTWPWLLRRGVVFWPLAALAGCTYATWHASAMGAWGDWPGLALRACIASLIAVSAGPLLATLIRHCRLPLVVERLLVLLAILCGLWIGVIALDWVSAYHAHLMQAYSGRPMGPNLLGQAVSNFLAATINASVSANSDALPSMQPVARSKACAQNGTQPTCVWLSSRPRLNRISSSIHWLPCDQ